MNGKMIMMKKLMTGTACGLCGDRPCEMLVNTGVARFEGFAVE